MKEEAVSQLDLIFQVLVAVVRVVVLALIGVYLAKKGTLKASDVKGLTSLADYVLLPSLCFVNFIHCLDLTDFGTWLPCVIIAGVNVLNGGFVGEFVNRIHLKDGLFKHIIVMACSLGHTTSVQLALVATFYDFLDKIPSPFVYRLKSDQRGITYIMLITIVNHILKWVVGRRYVEQAKEHFETHQLTNLSTAKARSEELSPVSAASSSSSISVASPDLPKQEENPTFWTPPIVAATMAIIVTTIPGGRDLFTKKDAFFYRALMAPLESCGRPLYAITLMVLGASLVINKQKAKHSYLKLTSLMGITLVRLVMLPLCGMITLYLCWEAKAIQDPTLIFILWVTYSTPTALSIMVQASKVGDLTGEISNLLLLGYIAAMFTMPLVLYLFFYVFLP